MQYNWRKRSNRVPLELVLFNFQPSNNLDENTQFLLISFSEGNFNEKIQIVQILVMLTR